MKGDTLKNGQNTKDENEPLYVIYEIEIGVGCTQGAKRLSIIEHVFITGDKIRRKGN